MNTATKPDTISELIEQRLSRYPTFHKPVREQIEKLGLCYMDAFTWLRSFEDKLKLPVHPLTINSHDQAIIDSANGMAKRCHRMLVAEMSRKKQSGATLNHRLKSIVMYARTICQGTSATFPFKESQIKDKRAVAVMILKLSDELWWRKQLRTQHARQLECIGRELGLTCKKRGGYVSHLTLSRRLNQRKRNRDLLEDLIAENDEGQVYTLAELSDLGVSNPANRRAELMTRLNGFEQCAAEGDYTPLFFTLTAPSRFHSHNRGGKQYENWNGSTPRDAQAHLCKLWSLARSAWHKSDIHPFGFRIAEPHHDGCPHWHLILWTPSDRAIETSAIFRHYALQDNPDENGADIRRLKIDFIDPEKGSAVGYVSKYVSKNIDGLDSNSEEWSSNSVKTAIRVEAWASTWGIRQFQQIGGAPVTVWRELRRVEESLLNDPLLEEVRKAADEGDWKTYTLKMGGVICPRKERPLRLWLEKKLDEAKQAITNKYGEIIRSIMGLLILQRPGYTCDRNFTTRWREWTVKAKERISDDTAQAVEAVRAPPSGATLDLCH